MAVDILGMIRRRREQRAVGIEELARRLAKGEAVSPEEIEAHLERTGCTEEQLQERVDAIERRAELLARVSAGNAAQARIDKLEGDIAKAFEAVVDAQRKHAAVRDKHADALRELRRTVEAASVAENELLDPANLPPADRARLAEARQAAASAVQSLSDLRRSMPDKRLALGEAERVLADAVEQAKANRSNADLQDRKARFENAVKGRRERLAAAEAELKRLQAAADAAEAAVKAIEDELRR